MKNKSIIIKRVVNLICIFLVIGWCINLADIVTNDPRSLIEWKSYHNGYKLHYTNIAMLIGGYILCITPKLINIVITQIWINLPARAKNS